MFIYMYIYIYIYIYTCTFKYIPVQLLTSRAFPRTLAPTSPSLRGPELCARLLYRGFFRGHPVQEPAGSTGLCQAPREGFKYHDSSCFEIFRQKAPVSIEIILEFQRCRVLEFESSRVSQFYSSRVLEFENSLLIHCFFNAFHGFSLLFVAFSLLFQCFSCLRIAFSLLFRYFFNAFHGFSLLFLAFSLLFQCFSCLRLAFSGFESSRVLEVSILNNAHDMT